MRHIHGLSLAALLAGVVLVSMSAGRGEEGESGGKLPNPFGAPAAESTSESTDLGAAVNSASSDFGPIISPDGNELYFTSDRPGGLGGQDVWVSRRVDGEWQQAENLGRPINTPDSEGPDSFSISESALYFTACDRELGQGGCDIYVSFRLKNGKWSEPDNLGPPVNTRYNDSNASISSDGSLLIFTSDRPGGLGGADLWMARRGEVIRKLLPGFSTAGRWEEPVNLGPNVNTPDWDGVGFLMPDNQTLYFSSRGRGGQGADVFRSVLTDGAWEPARSMGGIINTPRDDIYFTLPGSGDLAYFSSDQSGGLGQEDIYSIPIPLLIPKTCMVVLRGKVEDAASGAPIKASVQVVDPATSRVIGRAESNPESGDYQLVVQVERVRLEVASESHQSYSELVEVGGGQAMSMVTRDIKLLPEK
ncbi:MAG TPA: hypothetical protein VM658_19685 [bacterium]|nr:hypothetical protein [bacterium]